MGIPMEASTFLPSTSSTEIEAAIRAQYERKLQEHDAQRQREMQQWKQATEEQYHKLVEETVARRVAEELEALGIKDRPRKKPRAAVRDNGRRCSVCGSAGTGRDVHRHRELAIDLDGKCRKQVETFRHGGVLKDRREEWLATLIATDNQSELSRNMIAALSEPSKSDSKGRSPALSSTSLPSASPSADSMAVEDDSSCLEKTSSGLPPAMQAAAASPCEESVAGKRHTPSISVCKAEYCMEETPCNKSRLPMSEEEIFTLLQDSVDPDTLDPTWLDETMMIRTCSGELLGRTTSGDLLELLAASRTNSGELPQMAC